MALHNPQIYVSYDATAAQPWTFTGGLGSHYNIDASPGDCTVTFTLTGPSGAVFTYDPIDWPEGQPTCVSNVTGGGTTRISFTDDHTAAGGYRLKLNVKLADQSFVQSPDPTLINEGTGHQ